jgi:hypothetical protein
MRGRKIDKPCEVDGCDRTAISTIPILCCNMHNKRWWRYGSFEYRRKGKCHPNQVGYTIITVDKKQIQEHRYIMEQHLGRKLLSIEKVHHLNGNRSDNRIENLVVITQSEHIKQYHPKNLSNHFPKGHTPWNKGLSGYKLKPH